MPRQPSTETQLRTAKADIRRLNIELQRAQQQVSAYRERATKAEQDAAQWKHRFDILLVITKDGPKKDVGEVPRG